MGKNQYCHTSKTRKGEGFRIGSTDWKIGSGMHLFRAAERLLAKSSDDVMGHFGDLPFRRSVRIKSQVRLVDESKCKVRLPVDDFIRQKMKSTNNFQSKFKVPKDVYTQMLLVAEIDNSSDAMSFFLDTGMVDLDRAKRLQAYKKTIRRHRRKTTRKNKTKRHSEPLKKAFDTDVAVSTSQETRILSSGAEKSPSGAVAVQGINLALEAVPDIYGIGKLVSSSRLEDDFVELTLDEQKGLSMKEYMAYQKKLRASRANAGYEIQIATTPTAAFSLLGNPTSTISREFGRPHGPEIFPEEHLEKGQLSLDSWETGSIIRRSS